MEDARTSVDADDDRLADETASVVDRARTGADDEEGEEEDAAAGESKGRDCILATYYYN